MTSTLFRFSVVLSLAVLVACKASLSPDWTVFHTQAVEGEERIEWLSNVAVDPYGDVITAGETIRIGADRQVNTLLVKHDDRGNMLWATEYDLAQGAYRSDDNVTDMALDSDGNAYLVGVQYIVENDVQRYGSFMLKIDRWGEVVWAQTLSNKDDARDVEISGNKVYVTGHATQVFNLDGQRLLNIEHPDSKAWDIEVDNTGSIYVVGYAAAQKYSPTGVLLWSVAQPEGLTHQASIALNIDNSVVIAHLESRNIRVAAISSDGQVQWNKTYTPTQQSNGLPGHALVKTDWRGDIVLAVSNDKSRRIVKLNDAGQEAWQVSSSGIVRDFVIDDAGSVYIVGSGTNEKYDADGQFIAEATMDYRVEVTSGSIALDGQNIYVAYSANSGSTFNFFIAKYVD